MLTFNLFEVD